MPGAVKNATATTVMPAFLARHFVARREYLANENSYRNGERQVGLLVSTSRKSFELAAALEDSELVALRDFYEARNGDPFYFYYPAETVPPYSHDPSGAQTAGRYTVRFDGDWQQSAGLARTEVSLRLLEVN